MQCNKLKGRAQSTSYTDSNPTFNPLEVGPRPDSNFSKLPKAPFQKYSIIVLPFMQALEEQHPTPVLKYFSLCKVYPVRLVHKCLWILDYLLRPFHCHLSRLLHKHQTCVRAIHFLFPCPRLHGFLQGVELFYTGSSRIVQPRRRTPMLLEWPFR